MSKAVSDKDTASRPRSELTDEELAKVAGGAAQDSTVQVSHEIVSARDVASGLPTGKRMHKP